MINEAALLAARRSKKSITMKEIEEAVDRVMAGPERKSRVMSEEERRLIAYHEGGHAMVAHVLPNTDEVHKITVIPRGRALGYTLTLPEQDKFMMTREELRDELAMLMGGRVAEEIVAGDISTGAGNDIERATKIARQMVTEHGMSDSIGPRTLGQKQGEVFLGRDWASTPDYSDAVAFEIDNEVSRLLDEAHDVALEILGEHREKLDELAALLLAEGDVGSRGGRGVLQGRREARAPRPGGPQRRARGLPHRDVPAARRPRPAPAMTDRWATFDCYGTLIDWDGGVRRALGKVWPEEDGERLFHRYHDVEPRHPGGPGHLLPTGPARDVVRDRRGGRARGSPRPGRRARRLRAVVATVPGGAGSASRAPGPWLEARDPFEHGPGHARRRR